MRPQPPTPPLSTPPPPARPRPRPRSNAVAVVAAAATRGDVLEELATTALLVHHRGAAGHVRLLAVHVTLIAVVEVGDVVGFRQVAPWQLVRETEAPLRPVRIRGPWARRG